MDPKKLYDAAREQLDEGYENLGKYTDNQLAMKNLYERSALSFNRAISKIELLVKHANKKAKSWRMRYSNNSNSNSNNNSSRGGTRKRSKSR
jgi:hypothetical protein